MTLDELRDYAMLVRDNKMRSYQMAGTAMTEEQFRRAFAANMAEQGYSNLDPAQVDILASREWPKFKAGTSQYQFLAGSTPQAPMTASQVTSMPELSFIPPAISPDEVFPNPQSSMDPTMSPYAQQAMGQVTGFYPNQPAPTQGEQISPFARMAMGQASGDFMGMASQMPAFLQSMQQTPVGTPQPRTGEEDMYQPRTSSPDRWDRKVAREQARNANDVVLGTGPQQPSDSENTQQPSFFDQVLSASAMFNPGGADLEGTLYNIGRYAGSDSPYKGLQMGLSGASAVMKGGRSLLSGLGYAKASREARDFYDQQMRRRQYNPVEQSAYGYTGDIANAAYGGLFRYQPGGTSGTGELYKTALEQYDFFMKNPEAWEGDPEMTNPDGSFNLCLDCLNVDYSNPSDINDAVRLVNEGLSTGTHRNVEAFQQGLKTFNIQEPTFRSLKQNAFGGLFKFQDGGVDPVNVNYYPEVSRKSSLGNPTGTMITGEGAYPFFQNPNQSQKPFIVEKSSKSVYGSPYADDYFRNKTFQADNEGLLRSNTSESYYTNNVGGDRVISYPNRYVTMDTLGYSQGRQSFPVRVVDKNIADGFGGSYEVNEFDATREQVPSLIRSMKNQTQQSNKEKVAANKRKVEANKKKVEENRKKVIENQKKALGLKYKAGGSSTSRVPDFANDPRFQPGEYIEFEYGGKMYKGTVKENNGKSISLK